MDIEGIVFRIVQYKEKDAMITILTKDGFVSFLARGVLKIDSKNAVFTNLYTHAIFELQESKNGYLSLKSGKIINSPNYFMNSLEALLSLNAINEIVLKIDDEKALKNIFPYVKNGYELLIKNEIDPLLFSLLIGTQYLKENGYSMKVDGCVICDSKNKIVSFDFYSGGFICVKHFDSSIHRNQSEEYLKSMRMLFLTPSDKMDKVNISLSNIVLILTKMKEFMADNCGIFWSGIGTLIKCIRN